MPGEAVVTANGVTIIGYTDLAGRLPAQASQLYGTNLVNLMKLLTPGKDGRLVLDFDDVVQRSMTVVRTTGRADLAAAAGAGLGRARPGDPGGGRPSAGEAATTPVAEVRGGRHRRRRCCSCSPRSPDRRCWGT